jgi:hypothetical protein
MFLGLVVLAFFLGVIATLFVVRGPIPFIDRGFHIYAARDLRARNAMVEMLSVFGLKPRFRIDSSSFKRILMSDNLTVINHTDPELWESMGSPAAGLAIVVKNPVAAARAAAWALEDRGYSSQVLGELDTDVPPGTMVFVKTNALMGTVLVFRRHFFKLGKRPPKY